MKIIGLLMLGGISLLTITSCGKPSPEQLKAQYVKELAAYIEKQNQSLPRVTHEIRLEKFEISGNEVIDSITFLTNTVVELVSSSSKAEVYQSLIDKACSQA